MRNSRKFPSLCTNKTEIIRIKLQDNVYLEYSYRITVKVIALQISYYY